METTRQKVQKLLDQGLHKAEIARRLGLSRSTVTFHCTGLGVPLDEKCARRYDWAEIQRYYDDGHTVRECAEYFGFSHCSWHKAKERGDIVTRPQMMSIEELLASPDRNRQHIVKRLIAEGLRERKCETCGLTEWMGQPISLQLHHVNGNGRDNSLGNLQLVCPNCHSQTDTWGGRNKNRRLRLVNPEGQDEAEAA